MKLGIAGFGFVGQAVYNGILKERLNHVVIHDPPKGINIPQNGLHDIEAIFCCLPTPTNKTKDGPRQDFSAYEQLMGYLDGYKGILIVKSTLLYEYLIKLDGKFSVVHNPEFLNQNSANDDFQKQNTIILGGRADHCRKVVDIYENYFGYSSNMSSVKKVNFELCTLQESVDIKYVHNIYHAYKSLFWNFVYETTGNHRKMFDLYSKITGNKHEMAQVAADGKLGYGGNCFLKDVGAFHGKTQHELTRFMTQYNKKLRTKPNGSCDKCS